MTIRRLPSLILVTTVLAGCLVHTAGAASEYDRIVASTAARIESALAQERARPGSADKALGNLRRSIPSKVTVRNPDGSKIRTDLSWARYDISYAQRLKGKKRTERLKDVLTRLRTLEDASQGRQSGSVASSGQARNTLAKILAGKEYRESFEENAVQRMMGAIMRFLSRIFTPGTGEVIGWSLFVLLIVGAALLLVLLVLHLVNSRMPRKAKVTPTTIRQARLERPTTEILLGQAENDARAGRFREAFRSIYLAAILHLDHRQFVTYVDGTTNWEYTRSVRRLAPPATADVFLDMTMRFDNLIYGQKSVTDDEYAGFRRRYHELEETA